MRPYAICIPAPPCKNAPQPHLAKVLEPRDSYPTLTELYNYSVVYSNLCEMVELNNRYTLPLYNIMEFTLYNHNSDANYNLEKRQASIFMLILTIFFILFSC